MADFRAYLKPKNAQDVLGANNDKNTLRPLYSTGSALLFPYTPTITGTGTTVNYDTFDIMHTNYQQQVFKNSAPNDINISAQFTAQSIAEAQYAAAAIHFFRTITKAQVGKASSKLGQPPPVLNFSYLGNIFKDVPVVVRSFTLDLPNDVDYVEINDQFIPVVFTISAIMAVQYNVKKIFKEFSLDDFRTGSLLKGYI